MRFEERRHGARLFEEGFQNVRRGEASLRRWRLSDGREADARVCGAPLKAALKLLGIEYPREHDVSQILLSVQDRLPKWFNAEEYADHSRVLVSKRGPAMYGHEELLTPASEIFGVKDAEEALKMAREVHQACVRLIHEFERLSPLA